MLFVIAPASDRVAIKPLADLPMTDRGDGPLGPVEIETTRFPIQPQKLDQATALGLEVSDQILVVDLDHVQRP